MDERRIGHFKIVRHLGQGSAANAFLVENEQRAGFSVLKILKPAIARNTALAEGFIGAAESASTLSHPGIAASLSSGRIGPTYYAETEYIEGIPLKNLILQYGALDQSFCARIIKQAAAVLNFAHIRMQTPHGGINSKNIFIRSGADASETPVLTDFGLSLPLITGGVACDPAYLAPELFDRHGADIGADIYSLGVVLFELLTGKLPFQGASPDETVQLILSEDTPYPRVFNPGVSPAVEEVVLTCLRKNPGERYSAAYEIAAALNNLAPIPAPARTPAKAASVQPPGRGAQAYPAESKGSLKTPFLHVNQEKLFFSGKQSVVLLVHNPGEAPLNGEAKPSARWIKASPREFEVYPDQYAEITVRAVSLPTVNKNEAYLQLTSNGGDEQVRVTMDSAPILAGAGLMSAVATSVAALLGGCWFIWGIKSSPQTGSTPYFLLAGIAMFVFASIFNRDRGLAAAGFAAVLFCAWQLLDFSSGLRYFAIAALSCLAPLAIVFLLSPRLFKRMPFFPPAAILLPALLWAGFQICGTFLPAGGMDLTTLTRPPFAGVERRSTLNTGRTLHSFIKQPALSDEARGSGTMEMVSGIVVITARRANIRLGGGTEYPVLMPAGKGRSFPGIGENEGWYQIKLPENRTGWVSKSLSELEK